MLERQAGEPERVLAALREISDAIGVGGMVGGQYVDVAGDADLDADGLRHMHELKTGQADRAPASRSRRCCSARPTRRADGARAASRGELGVLFQIVDDILDVTGSEEETGKPAGADERLGKRTYVSVFGLERGAGARRRVPRAGARRRSTRRARTLAGDATRPRADDRLHVHAREADEPRRQARTSPSALLDRVDGPADLKELDDDQLQQLAQEVREYIIDTVGEIGGHFGANLGACELAVALHSVLDSPRDKILWDVGHQAYPHKVLTGRRDELPSIRQYGGLAPFCSREESEHDIMGAGHASTAASYAVGIKEAMRKRERARDRRRTSTGRARRRRRRRRRDDRRRRFEALHNAGGLDTPIVIVLNDNGMSISPNVGALSRYFNRLRLNPQRLPRARGARDRADAGCPAGIGRQIERLGPQLKESLKAFWAPGLFFEELDLAYVGVIDGHDVKALRRALRQALGADRPVVVHVKTVKGKGFAPAEDGGLEGMEKWHAAKPGSIVKDGRAADGAQARSGRAGAKPPPPQYTEVFGARAGRGGAPRPARDRHHRRDGRRHRPVACCASELPGPVLRRRDRRAARGAVRGRARARGHEAGRGDLLDLPAARVRPDRPRRLPPEAERRVLHGPRRAGRRRRPDPPRRLRHLLPAADPEHRR